MRSRPEIGIINSQLSGNFLGSVWMNNGGVLGLNGSSLSGGARGVTLDGSDKSYVFITNNSSISATTDAMWLKGDANSGFNLGSVSVTTGFGPNYLFYNAGAGAKLRLAEQ